MGFSKLLAGLLAATLLACATPYGSGLMGGVQASWVSPNAIVVSAKGNAFADDARMADFTVLKAAEEAFNAGYKYIIPINSENTGKTAYTTLYSPYSTNYSGTASTFGSSTTYSGTATTTGGPRTYGFYKPGRVSTFAVTNELPEGILPGQYFETVFILNSLGPKYITDFQPIIIPALPS